MTLAQLGSVPSCHCHCNRQQPKPVLCNSSLKTLVELNFDLTSLARLPRRFNTWSKLMPILYSSGTHIDVWCSSTYVQSAVLRAYKSSLGDSRVGFGPQSSPVQSSSVSSMAYWALFLVSLGFFTALKPPASAESSPE
jgi:hypothetical protein